ncbi:beta-ketoacyl-ACP synthase III [Pseudobacteroides cellulosolvens]|uniref:Beta-ketoacyl-[acyl-carrier-protein] synthase III n=1 Tax=Pseudobacteroides cellulosolvens ATCC 35603 = DSM 2933 TaxID=398512 RepID=A0A0L6JJV0_9FIRM|nr:beta-ketoacyl-ACP synthase III [Pseudobacteroides cellulosolvens]KNY26039.1 3-oxoacyl-(acyl-carrier-protein) synthase 3 [Pseudobacteroides cellulosolvens ATCC 35603 = DSM 2933]
MSNERFGIGVLGLGISIPKNVLTNSDLEKMVDTSDEWIMKRTGISERRILDKDQPAFELGAEAAKMAIKDSGLTPEDIDLIIVATETPDYLTPSTSCIIHKLIGANKAAAFDLNAACSGFMYGLTVAKQFLENGFNGYKNILVIGCEGLSKIVDYSDRASCILFGDGAGAMVVGKVEEGYGILSSYMGADGSLGNNITMPCCSINESDLSVREHENKNVLWMNGSEVFKFAVRVMEQSTRWVLDDKNISLDDVSLIVPHQANIRIIEGAAKRLNVPNEKVYSNLNKYGNTSSASIPIALYEAIQDGLVKKGDNIVMVGFGGGLTWGSVLLKWNK